MNANFVLTMSTVAITRAPIACKQAIVETAAAVRYCMHPSLAWQAAALAHRSHQHLWHSYQVDWFQLLLLSPLLLPLPLPRRPLLPLLQGELIINEDLNLYDITRSSVQVSMCIHYIMMWWLSVMKHSLPAGEARAMWFAQGLP
jgi:hypothetical protein